MQEILGDILTGAKIWAVVLLIIGIAVSVTYAAVTWFPVTTASVAIVFLVSFGLWFTGFCTNNGFKKRTHGN